MSDTAFRKEVVQLAKTINGIAENGTRLAALVKAMAARQNDLERRIEALEGKEHT